MRTLPSLKIVSKLVLFSAAFLAGAKSGTAQNTSVWPTQCTASSPVSPYECIAQHQVRTDSNQVLFQISIVTREGQDGARLDLTAPLGFYIPGGVQIFRGDTLLLDLAVSRCTSNGCFAEIQLDDDDIDVLARSSELRLAFLTNSETSADVSVPVAGLADSISLITQ